MLARRTVPYPCVTGSGFHAISSTVWPASRNAAAARRHADSQAASAPEQAIPMSFGLCSAPHFGSVPDITAKSTRAS